MTTDASEESLVRVLTSLGIETDEESLRLALSQSEAGPCERPLSKVLVHRAPETPPLFTVSIPEPLSRRLRWMLELEGGQRIEGEFDCSALEIVERRNARDRVFALCRAGLPQPLPIGYHRLSVQVENDSRDEHASSLLIVAPQRAYQPAALEGEARHWQLSLDLTSARSVRNWGSGDLSDLRTALDFAAYAGAAGIATGSLHAALGTVEDRDQARPVASRSAIDILLLDVESVEDYPACESALALVASAEFQAELRAIRAADTVASGRVRALKHAVCERLFVHFRDQHLRSRTERARAFESFRRNRPDLELHALHAAIEERLGAGRAPPPPCTDWPEGYRDPDAAASQLLRREAAERIAYHLYVQWQAALQLELAGQRSLSLALPLGLCLDVEDGCEPAGAEAWAGSSSFAPDMRLAHRDPLTRSAILATRRLPWHPRHLRESDYAAFRTLLHISMRDAGAVRLRHAAWLATSWWVPAGDGTAVQPVRIVYPLDELLAVLALESHRHACLVIAGDADDVDEALATRLRAEGLLLERVMLPAPDDKAVARETLLAVDPAPGPTLAAFWAGTDIDQCRSLADEERGSQIVRRAQARARLLLALDQAGLLPAGVSAHPVSTPEMTAELANAIHILAASSVACVLEVRAADLLGECEPRPGAAPGAAIARRSLDLESWLEEARVRALLRALRDLRGGPAPGTLRRRRRRALVVPRASYRLQLNSGFRFADAAAIVPYLSRLGVSHLYLSPILRARPGSQHGYDITDHSSLNPELGTREEFSALVRSAREHGMGLILDIVPNHMGVMGNDNQWWLDVLENGPAARHAEAFDIDWEPTRDTLRDRLLVPVLGQFYGAALEAGELVIEFDAAGGNFSVRYYEHVFPIDPREYPRILTARAEQLGRRLPPEHESRQELESLITAFAKLPARSRKDEMSRIERYRDKELGKRRLARLVASSADIRAHVEESVREINGEIGLPASFDRLQQLLEAQPYRLAYWRVAVDEINYRRFFDINDLAALRMERPEIFAATHGLILDLIERGDVDGLRIDHPDGLFDPAGYYERLQSCFLPASTAVATNGKPTCTIYVVAEKILAGHERLPDNWAIHGTTGYEFGAAVHGLLIESQAEEAFDRIYRQFTGRSWNFDEIVYQSKRLVMKTALASEVNVLATQLDRIAQLDRRTADFTLNTLRDALTEVIACFPVYRTYVSPRGVSEEDRRYVHWAVAVARRRSQAGDLSIFDFIENVLLGDIATGRTEAYGHAVLDFSMKFQQVTAPVTAKGVEDTAGYIYNRLISLNEVGGEPRRFGCSVQAFHQQNIERLRRTPHALLATSTHDAKRSEDVRARLAVLTEIPEEWRRQLARWSRLNRHKRRTLEQGAAPSRNDEYLIYQTLLGAWPLSEPDEAALEAFRERIRAYVLKATREAKSDTSWMNPQEPYEQACAGFIDRLLERPERNAFLYVFRPFARLVSFFGSLNSLTQTVLKLTCPGVPDLYQGTELPALCLVDPDNRRAIDYQERSRRLQALLQHASDPVSPGAQATEAMLDWTNGTAKLLVTACALELRRQLPALFERGDYLPLAAIGGQAAHICAYARVLGAQRALIITTRAPATLVGFAERLPLGEAAWSDTAVEIPADWDTGELEDVFTGRRLRAEPAGANARLAAHRVFEHLSVALLAPVSR